MSTPHRHRRTRLRHRQRLPGPQRAFGLARPGATPATTAATPGVLHCAGYSYADTHVGGFSRGSCTPASSTTAPSGFACPPSGCPPPRPGSDGRLGARHERRPSHAGYYRVAFEERRDRHRVTATEHVAPHRVTFPRGADGHHCSSTWGTTLRRARDCKARWRSTRRGRSAARSAPRRPP
nr:hypothetical protein [Deltaproteobacteria bacterium]